VTIDEDVICSFCNQTMHLVIKGGRHGLAVCKNCVGEATTVTAAAESKCWWCGITFGDRRPERIHTFVGYPEHRIRIPEGLPAQPRQIRGRALCHNCVDDMRLGFGL
jgi:hypothetical protein